MAIVEEAQVLQVLRGFNPWWTLGGVPETLTRPWRRVAFYEALRILERHQLRRAVLLSGARRVGKTTILHQLVEHHLRAGWRPERILYVSFDHPILKLLSLERLLDVYRLHVSEGASEVLVLLDEVHYASDWATWLKLLVDRHPGYRVVATGSASARLQAAGRESGVGRWTTVHVPTLSYYEYLRLRQVDAPLDVGDVDVTRLPRLAPAEVTGILHRCLFAEPHLTRYLLVGGFPETALADDLGEAQRLLREDIVDRVLKRDMTALYGVRNVLDLERLFVYLCLHSGSIVALDAVARELGVSRTKVANDVVSLELAHLVYRSDPVDLQGKRALKARPKVYLADPALRNAVLLLGDEVLTRPVELGQMVETAVYAHVRHLFAEPTLRVGYWRDRQGDHEVDVVVAGPSGMLLAAEVKYRETVPPQQLGGLARLLAGRPGLPGLVITKRAADVGPWRLRLGRRGPGPRGERAVEVFRIPAFAFLYLAGRQAAARAGAVA